MKGISTPKFRFEPRRLFCGKSRTAVVGRLIEDNLDWRDEGGRKKGTGGGAGNGEGAENHVHESSPE